MTSAPTEKGGTKMRLIDADKVKSKLQQHRDLFVDAWGGFDKMSLADKNRVDEIDNCIAEIVNAPTIEAAPVVHGRWDDFCNGKMCCCSACKAEFDNACNEIHG